MSVNCLCAKGGLQRSAAAALLFVVLFSDCHGHGVPPSPRPPSKDAHVHPPDVFGSDSEMERVRRGLGGGVVCSPMALDTPLHDDEEESNTFADVTPRRLNFDTPEPEPRHTHTQRESPKTQKKLFGGPSVGGSAHTGERDSSPDPLLTSPLLNTPLPKGRDGLGFRTHRMHEVERVNKFALGTGSPISTLPPGSAGRFKMSRRLTSAPSFYRDFFDIQEIGRGEHGTVFRCVRKIDLWPYAVKMLPKCNSANDREKALQEIYALAAQGDNPHALRYYNAWEEDDIVYIQTELCLETIYSEWRVAGPLPEARLIRVLAHVGACLRHMHKHGVVHLDVKPANIYESPSGLLKLGDFGHARDVTAGPGLRDEDGDRRYLAPEAFQDGKVRDLSATDMFALGASVYELASKHRLPEKGEDYQSLRAGKVRPLNGVSPALNRIVLDLMHPDPDLRTSARQLLLIPDIAQAVPQESAENIAKLEKPDHLHAQQQSRVASLHARLLQTESEMALVLDTVKDLQAQVQYWKRKAGPN